MKNFIKIMRHHQRFILKTLTKRSQSTIGKKKVIPFYYYLNKRLQYSGKKGVSKKFYSALSKRNNKKIKAFKKFKEMDEYFNQVDY